jgi:hypothetical protein
MRVHQGVPARVNKGVALVVGLLCSGALIAFADETPSSRTPDPAKEQIEASIFSYDGHDFVRTKTTLKTADGKVAVDTKLEHDSPAYKALSQKHSYVGEATVFGRKYAAGYAPLTTDDGKLTGALFVGVAK